MKRKTPKKQTFKVAKPITFNTEETEKWVREILLPEIRRQLRLEGREL